MKIEDLNDRPKVWDEFIESSSNGTIFHTQRFLSYHGSEKYQFSFLGFYDDNSLQAVLPCVVEKQSHLLRSPVGATYGGLIVRKETLENCEQTVNCLLDFAASNGIKSIYVTPPPCIYSSPVNEIYPFIFAYKGFIVANHLITNAVNLKRFRCEDEVLPNISESYRRAINKSFKSELHVSISDEYAEYYDILVKNKKMHDAKPTHTLQELILLKELFPQHITLLMARDPSGTAVGGVLLIKCNQSTLLAFYIAQDYDYQDLRVTNRVLYESVLFGIRNGFDWLDLGVSMDVAHANPMEPSRKLIHFKEKISSTGFLRTTFLYKSP